MSKPKPKKQIAQSLQNIADLIGIEKAVALSNAVKHRHFYIKKEFLENHFLIAIIGRPSTFILHKHFAGELLHITPSGSYHTEAKRLFINGMPICKIARRFNVSMHAITRIVTHLRPRPAGGGCRFFQTGDPCGGKGTRKVSAVSARSTIAEA